MPGLTPLPGFNWLQVSWGGPDEPRTLKCSYCDTPIGDDDDDPLPLILWNDKGWCAEFCNACQVRWWGLHPIDSEPFDDDYEDPDGDEPAK